MNELQKAIYRRSICWRVGEIIAEDFANAMLVTLHCSAPAAMPPELAKKVYRTWRASAQRIAGGSFKHIRVTDYGPHPVPQIVFHVVADLPRDICREVCAEWYMGESSAVPLDERGMERLADSIMYQDSKSMVRIWSYCRGAPRAPAVVLAQ